MQKALSSTLLLLAIFLLAGLQPVDARSGCCSHHGGVCGCGCCDSSPLSTICAPYHPQCSSTGASAINNVQVSQAVASVTLQPIITPSPTITPTLTATPTPQPTKKAERVNILPQQPTPQPQNFWTLILKFFHLL